MPPLCAKRVCIFLVLGLWIAWNLALSPAAAQGLGAKPRLEKPQPSPERPGPGEKQEDDPKNPGPIICEGCIPIGKGNASLEWLGALSLYFHSFSPNWRHVSAGGNFYTFNMPVKFTYGPADRLETFIVAPFIVNWINDSTVAAPNGARSASYAGIGDITTVAKYLVLEEAGVRPAVALVGGVGWPSGHASHLNPRFLTQDEVGTGSFNFITGVNLFLSEWIKPFQLTSNIWLNSPINLFRLRGSDLPQAVRNRENVTFNLAVEYPLNKRWVLLLEMYSTWTWSNPGTESIGFQSPTTLLGFLPGIEYVYSKKWSFSAGCAFDTLGKFGLAKLTPTVTVNYNF
jgi:hypothetical protein